MLGYLIYMSHSALMKYNDKLSLGVVVLMGVRQKLGDGGCFACCPRSQFLSVTQKVPEARPYIQGSIRMINGTHR